MVEDRRLCRFVVEHVRWWHNFEENVVYYVTNKSEWIFCESSGEKNERKVMGTSHAQVGDDCLIQRIFNDSYIDLTHALCDVSKYRIEYCTLLFMPCFSIEMKSE